MDHGQPKNTHSQSLKRENMRRCERTAWCDDGHKISDWSDDASRYARGETQRFLTLRRWISEFCYWFICNDTFRGSQIPALPDYGKSIHRSDEWRSPKRCIWKCWFYDSIPSLTTWCDYSHWNILRKHNHDASWSHEFTEVWHLHKIAYRWYAISRLLRDNLWTNTKSGLAPARTIKRRTPSGLTWKIYKTTWVCRKENIWICRKGLRNRKEI